MSKIPQRQEIWVNDYSQAYVLGVTGYGFVQYIQKTGEVYITRFKEKQIDVKDFKKLLEELKDD